MAGNEFEFTYDDATCRVFTASPTSSAPFDTGEVTWWAEHRGHRFDTALPAAAYDLGDETSRRDLQQVVEERLRLRSVWPGP